MERKSGGSALVLGLCIFFGLAVLGYLLGNAAVRFKEFERSVTVKGLSERELPADIVIWPVQFTAAGNELGQLYLDLEASTKSIVDYLVAQGLDGSEVSVDIPRITDKSAQSYGSATKPDFRYSAVQTVTVYSGSVDRVRASMRGLAELGKRGIVFSGSDYQNQTEYIFTGLNRIKPEMIQEATTKAREVALKFAEDSQSTLGKIKRASQGQFSITPRDKNNPHIKRVRVVSTVEYYLSD